MPIIRVTKEFRFEMAHALTNYDGKCKYIHGHSYVLKITVSGQPIEDENNSKLGMVIDFSDLKNIVNDNIIERFDHALVLSKKAKLADDLKCEYQKVEIVDYQPTCENLVMHFVEILKPLLPENVFLHHLKLHETATSCAEWFAADNQ
ncbi:MAG: 6-carboxytetrahydropterin synthase [Prevotellaceae bacterium]|jgi:6-pyruvoyltetrahydropterin/6-carboxytetrahydropterin synthase|nr:6-carboxytetrahydropterin synthase [Prevotellaceae bacterium]